MPVQTTLSPGGERNWLVKRSWTGCSSENESQERLNISGHVHQFFFRLWELRSRHEEKYEMFSSGV